MSNFDNAHNVVVYVSGATKAYTGQRLSKILFKGVASIGEDGVKTVTKPDNLAVSLPVISSEDIASRMLALIPHIRSMLESVQDKIVRESVVSNPGKLLINGDAVSMNAVLEYLSADADGGRMTKESIASWFSESMEANLAAAFAEKLGIGEVPTAAESEKVLAICAEYSSKLQMLAGGKTAFSPDVAVKLERALEIGASADDEIACKFRVRLAKMAKVASADLLGL